MTGGAVGLLLVAFLVIGCAPTLSEIRAEPPSMTRRAVGEPATILACVQDYLEDHYGGAWERFGNTAYTTRSEGGVLHLIARETGRPFAGSNGVRFDLAAVQTGLGQTELSMRVGPTRISPMYALQEPGLRTAIDACAPTVP